MSRLGTLLLLFLLSQTSYGAPRFLEEVMSARTIIEEEAEKSGGEPLRKAELLLSVGRFEEAEPLLLESYPIIESAKEAPPKRKGEALQRIIDLYDAWGKAEPDKGHDAKAAEWQAKLPTTQPTSHPASQPATRPAVESTSPP